MSDPPSDGGFFGNLFGGGGVNTGNPQQDQLYRYMMAQQLMKGMQPNFTPTSSGMGAVGQGMSPLVSMLLMSRMGQGGARPQGDPLTFPGGFAPAMTPGQQGQGGFVAPMGPGPGAGNPSGGPMGPLAIPPTPAAVAAPVAPVGAGAVGGLATPAVNPAQGFVDSGTWAF